MFALSESFEPDGQVNETRLELYKCLKCAKTRREEKSFSCFALHDFKYIIIAP